MLKGAGAAVAGASFPGLATADDGQWSVAETPTGENLTAVVRGETDIAVGAGGTVIER